MDVRIKEDVQNERQVTMFQNKSTWSSMILKKNGSLERMENKRKWLEQKDYAIRSEGDHRPKLHSEWTSVHDKIAHKEAYIKKLQEQLEKDDKHVQETRDKWETTECRKACKLEKLDKESQRSRRVTRRTQKDQGQDEHEAQEKLAHENPLGSLGWNRSATFAHNNGLQVSSWLASCVSIQCANVGATLP